jgi:hypothetical protein
MEPVRTREGAEGVAIWLMSIGSAMDLGNAKAIQGAVANGHETIAVRSTRLIISTLLQRGAAH